MATPQNESTRSSALEDSLVVSTAPVNLISVMATLDPTAGTVARCVMIFNATSLPANGTVPAWSFPCNGASGAGYAFGDEETLYLDTGCVVAFSSTYDDLTVTTGSEGTFSAQFQK